MKQRDIYIVSVPRGALRVQNGPNGRGPASAWRKLSRVQVARLIRDRLNGGCAHGVKVFVETRQETATRYAMVLAAGRAASARRRGTR